MFQTSSIGLDVHAKSIHAAVLDTTTGELTSKRLSDATDAAVIDFIHTHCNDPTNACVVYEAGPTGYHLARALSAANIDCDIIATSKLTRPTGDKVKTDKREAEFLARVAAVGEYTTVRIPTVEEESARDLVRARDDIRQSLVSAKHRTSKLLLRQGFVFAGKTAWIDQYWQWLRRIRADGLDGAGPGSLAAFDYGYEAIATLDQRRRGLDRRITEAAATSTFAPTVPACPAYGASRPCPPTPSPSKSGTGPGSRPDPSAPTSG
ncbi:IS110 family transposase [Brevibacterium sp. VCM10]|uniref:IS110 family transposase n=1 Tax=Brevibacterium sp. VCM10 TaxID=1381751 RepID=UPI0004AC7A27|nr:transposase [Brevibacterium sp. VCM10]